MANCILDGRPAESFLCPWCWGKLERDLQNVAWLVTELDAVISRSVKRGGGSIGFITRTAEQPLVFDTTASDVADELHRRLVTAVQDLHEVHGIRWQICSGCDVHWYGGEKHHSKRNCHGTWIEHRDELRVRDNSVDLASWIVRHRSWVTGHPAADELVDELTEALKAAWRTIDRQPGRQYLGICSAELEDGFCTEDVYGREDRALAVCQSCGTEHLAADRREVLMAALEEQLVEVRDLAGILVNYAGRNVSTSAIRNLKHRGRIVPKVNVNGTIRPRIPEDEGPDRFLVSDVIDAVVHPYRREKRDKTVTCA